MEIRQRACVVMAFIYSSIVHVQISLVGGQITELNVHSTNNKFVGMVIYPVCTCTFKYLLFSTGLGTSKFERLRNMAVDLLKIKIAG